MRLWWRWCSLLHAAICCLRCASPLKWFLPVAPPVMQQHKHFLRYLACLLTYKYADDPKVGLDKWRSALAALFPESSSVDNPRPSLSCLLIQLQQVIGWGSQAPAQAQNIRDSLEAAGVDIPVRTRRNYVGETSFNNGSCVFVLNAIIADPARADPPIPPHEIILFCFDGSCTSFQSAALRLEDALRTVGSVADEIFHKRHFVSRGVRVD